MNFNRKQYVGSLLVSVSVFVSSGPDAVGLSVNLTSPTNTAAISGQVQISADASGTDGIERVEFSIDGQLVSTDLDPPYGLAWETSLTTNGVHSIEAKAFDTVGDSVSHSVDVDVSNFGLFINELVVQGTGLRLPVSLDFLPDGRMVIGQIRGAIFAVQPGASQADSTPLLQVPNVFASGDAGLLKIEVDPNFDTNGFLYVFYVTSEDGVRDRVSRFTVSGDVADPASEVVLWQGDADNSQGHRGAGMVFGSDDTLFFTTGDHINTTGLSQDLTSDVGKLMRIYSDGSVPTNNPFFDGAGPNKDEIWAYGLRNPFRLAFDPVFDKLYFGDVGGNDHRTAHEEVNVVAAGGNNYGWPDCEGPCAIAGVTSPLYSYFHNNRDASVTGGVVYRGSQFPSGLVGAYFFGDYAQNWIKCLTLDATGTEVVGVFNVDPVDGSLDEERIGDIVDFVVGPDGALYYMDLDFDEQAHVRNAAGVRRISYVLSNAPPTAVAGADVTTNSVAPLVVQFSSAGSFDPDGQPLTFHWDFGDGTTSTNANPINTYTNEGTFVVVLTVNDGVHTAFSDPILIEIGTPPVAVVTAPADTSTFQAGDLIQVEGVATNLLGGPLPQDAFSWRVIFHHAGHIHPFLGPVTGTNELNFTIPTSGHDYQGFTRYEIILTVTNLAGLQDQDSVFIFPEKVDLHFDTIPSGLRINFDGISKITPFVVDELTGFPHTFEAPNQTLLNSNFTFSSWSDGGAQSHIIVTPSANSNYVVTFDAELIPVPSGLVAAYGFDEGEGTSLADASGNTNTGTMIGPSWTEDGKFGAALSFDGLDDLVLVESSPSLNLDSGMTLEAWINPTVAQSGWRTIIQREVDAYILHASHNGGALQPVGGGTFGGSVEWIAGPAASPLNDWTHLASTYDGTTLRLYVNGVEVSTRAVSGLIETNSNPLRMGGNSPYGEYFAGLIDEVRVYNRALTQAEIQADMVVPLTIPANVAPSISQIDDQTVAQDNSLEHLDFVVTDNESPSTSLVVTAESSNPGLIAVSNITFEVHEDHRTMAIVPSTNQHGTATITLTVSDGDLTASTSFLVTVLRAIPTAPPTITYSTGPGQITIGWPLDYIGWTLELQTNVLVEGLSTNWVSVSGSDLTNSVVIPIAPGNAANFYRLFYQPQ